MFAFLPCTNCKKNVPLWLQCSKLKCSLRQCFIGLSLCFTLGKTPFGGHRIFARGKTEGMWSTDIQVWNASIQFCGYLGSPAITITNMGISFIGTNFRKIILWAIKLADEVTARSCHLPPIVPVFIFCGTASRGVYKHRQAPRVRRCSQTGRPTPTQSLGSPPASWFFFGSVLFS